MRVRGLRLDRFREEQRGAVLLVVAISLTAMLTLLVLTFDIGHVVAARRDLVNASDSGALAAAQACALGEGTTAATTAAEALVDQNTLNQNPATTTVAPPPECDVLETTALKSVTVSSETGVDYFFAQVLGFNSATVTTTAVAQWGPAIGVANPVPLRLPILSDPGMGSIRDCLAEDIGYVGPACAFGFDNTNPNGGSASNWGILDFPEGWPTAPPNPGACDSQAGGANDVIDYLSGAAGDFTPVMWTSPVFVCAEGGLTATTLNWIIDWLIAHVGESLIFPVMAEPCTPGPPADPTTCADPVITPGGQSFPVVGFVSLSVMGAWKGREARDHCTFTTNNASLFCIQLRRDGVQVVPGIPGTGLFFNIKAVRLVD